MHSYSYVCRLDPGESSVHCSRQTVMTLQTVPGPWSLGSPPPQPPDGLRADHILLHALLSASFPLPRFLTSFLHSSLLYPCIPNPSLSYFHSCFPPVENYMLTAVIAKATVQCSRMDITSPRGENCMPRKKMKTTHTHTHTHTHTYTVTCSIDIFVNLLPFWFCGCQFLLQFCCYFHNIWHW